MIPNTLILTYEYLHLNSHRSKLNASFSLFHLFIYEGVYQHQKGVPLGGHAIKMIGWGVDNETGK